MPKADRYAFSIKELLELLIQHADVHEGRWVLSVNFTFSAGNFGPSNDQMLPGAIAAITRVGIERAQEDTPTEMTLDASVVNPPRAPKGKRRSPARSRAAGPSIEN